MLFKIAFLLAGIVGIIAVFYVSWFWRGLIIPMVVILFADVILGIFKKK